MTSCLACGTLTTYHQCNVCSMSHCSQKCREENDKLHQIVCHTTIEDRLRSIADYIVDEADPDRKLQNICCAFYIPTCPGVCGAFLSPFCHCIICGYKFPIKTYPEGTSSRGNKYIVYRGKKLEFLLCATCTDLKRELCPKHFHCTSKCTQIESWWTLLGCVNRVIPSIPKDIKQMLFQFVKPCNH